MLGTYELIVVVFAAILFFGGKKVPELARGLGSAVREFNNARDEKQKTVKKK